MKFVKFPCHFAINQFKNIFSFYIQINHNHQFYLLALDFTDVKQRLIEIEILGTAEKNSINNSRFISTYHKNMLSYID